MTAVSDCGITQGVDVGGRTAAPSGVQGTETGGRTPTKQETPVSEHRASPGFSRGEEVNGAPEWPDDEALPAHVLAARTDPGVIAALAELFRRNCRTDDGERRVFVPGEEEALAQIVLDRLLHPEHFRQAAVRGLRFDLDAGSELYPVPPVIWASVWDDDDEVWWRVGCVELSAVGPATDN